MQVVQVLLLSSKDRISICLSNGTDRLLLGCARRREYLFPWKIVLFTKISVIYCPYLLSLLIIRFSTEGFVVNFLPIKLFAVVIVTLNCGAVPFIHNNA